MAAPGPAAELPPPGLAVAECSATPGGSPPWPSRRPGVCHLNLNKTIFLEKNQDKDEPLSRKRGDVFSEHIEV